jgi:spoIIIJ-associated protein
MLEVVKQESKNKEEALNKCLEKLNVNLNEVYSYIEEESGLFGKKKYTAYVVTKYAVKDFVRNYLQDLAKEMNTTFNIEVNEKDDIISAIIVSDDSAVLIGKEGRTLNAIQTVIRQALRKYNFNIKVNVDIANYKVKRERNIEREVRKIAKEVMETKLPAKLDPMNSYERRIVHTIISEYDELATQSEGEAPFRYVVIKIKED